MRGWKLINNCSKIKSVNCGTAEKIVHASIVKGLKIYVLHSTWSSRKGFIRFAQHTWTLLCDSHWVDMSSALSPDQQLCCLIPGGLSQDFSFISSLNYSAMATCALMASVCVLTCGFHSVHRPYRLGQPRNGQSDKGNKNDKRKLDGGYICAFGKHFCSVATNNMLGLIVLCR